jgi:hypothetical protein
MSSAKWPEAAATKDGPNATRVVETTRGVHMRWREMREDEEESRDEEKEKNKQCLAITCRSKWPLIYDGGQQWHREPSSCFAQWINVGGLLPLRILISLVFKNSK